MRKWLYVISENGGKEIKLKKGEPVAVSVDSFKLHVLRENLSEKDPWHINILRVQVFVTWTLYSATIIEHKVINAFSTN